jgi:hypothetical protein
MLQFGMMLNRESQMSKTLPSILCIVTILALCLCSSCGEDESPCSARGGDVYVQYYEWDQQSYARLTDGDTLHVRRVPSQPEVGWKLFEFRTDFAWEPCIRMKGLLTGEARLDHVAAATCECETLAVDSISFDCDLGRSDDLCFFTFSVLSSHPDTMRFTGFTYRACCADPASECTGWTDPIAFTVIDTLSR